MRARTLTFEDLLDDDIAETASPDRRARLGDVAQDVLRGHFPNDVRDGAEDCARHGRRVSACSGLDRVVSFVARLRQISIDVFVRVIQRIFDAPAGFFAKADQIGIALAAESGIDGEIP